MNLLDEYSFTFHPQYKIFCPMHKECQKLIRRDSALVVVPKFQLKAVSDEEIRPKIDKRNKSIMVDFEIIHPVTKSPMFQKHEINI